MNAEEPRQGRNGSARGEHFEVGLYGEARMFGNKEYGRRKWKERAEKYGHAVSYLVEVLCYKPEGCEFDS
jgi:hypothetical protein